jgi:hypothetical protein
VLFTFPSRYSFTIGLSLVFSLTGWSRWILTGFLVSRHTQDTTILLTIYVYGTITPSGPTFQLILLIVNNNIVVLQPQPCRNTTGLGCFHFARHYSGNHYCFLFLPVLRCFSSQGLLPYCYGYHVFYMVGCPIRKSSDRKLFALPRSLSQLITSFFACESLGIPHTPLSTFFFIF